jgi:hypothetical protein
MRFLGFVIAVLIAGALTGCGSSVNSASSGSPAATVTKTVTGGGSAPAASSGTAATTTPGAGTTSATATSTGPQACRASGLGLSFLGQQVATGHGELGFSLHNTGSVSCGTIGYPGIQFLDRAGAALPTVPSHTTQDFFGRAPVSSLVVQPGQSVSFRLGVTHGAASSAGCRTAYGVRVIPPNDTATLTTQIPGGAYECMTATVSPLRPGDSAYP